MRIPVEMEATGADVAKHNEIAYPKEAWTDASPADLVGKGDGGNSWMPSQLYDKMDHPLSLRKNCNFSISVFPLPSTNSI